MELLGPSLERIESFGARAQAWAVEAAGPNAGNIQISATTAGPEELGRLQDWMAAEGPGPLGLAMRSADPPATLVAVVTTMEIPLG